MADTGIFATTAEVQRKVGVNASAVSNVEAYINQYMTEAESYINAVTSYNWSDAYATLNADVREILKMAASCLAAMDVLNYDSSGLSNRDFETRIDILDYKANKAIQELKQNDTRAFMNKA